MQVMLASTLCDSLSEPRPTYLTANSLNELLCKCVRERVKNQRHIGVDSSISGQCPGEGYEARARVPPWSPG